MSADFGVQTMAAQQNGTAQSMVNAQSDAYSHTKEKATRPTFTDSPEQAAVIQADVDANMLVVAGAGSGKTYTMTRRIVSLIEQGVSPEHILGLTFTRKAASELSARVSAAIPGNQQFAFMKPQVMTYDAFFQAMVRQYGLLVGFNQDTQPLSDAGAWQLASRVVGQHLELLSVDDFTSFSDVVKRVLNLSAAMSGSMIGEDCTGLDEAIAKVQQWDEAFIAQLDSAIGTEPVPENEPKASAPKRTKRDTDAQYEQKVQAYRATLHSLCVYRCAEMRTVAKKRDIIAALVQEYAHEKRRLNMAEFSDFTIAALQLVTRFPSIAQEYRRQFSHVLLDEYQDTSTTQSMLLATLFHNERRQKSMYTNTVEETFSMEATTAVNAVGDPFQSIYAWRGASPGAFRMLQEAFAMGENTKPYPLSVTRRNARLILQAANNLTLPLRISPRKPSSSLMREVDVPALHTLETAPLGTLGVLGFATLGQEIDAIARFAAHAIARHTPRNQQEKDVRPHVAVLFRSRSLMPDFAKGLEEAGLSTLIVGYSAVLAKPEVQDLLALLQSVSDHTDSDALMRLLSTPRFGLSAQTLTSLANEAQDLNTGLRYRALVEAGLINPGVSKERIADIVKAHRDAVPNALFLADLMLRSDIVDILRGSKRFDNTDIDIIDAAGRTLRAVQAVINHPLNEIIDTAINALQLDIDTVVARTLAYPDEPVSAAVAHSALNAIANLVDTFIRELNADQTPTLQGFLLWVTALGNIEEESAFAPDVPVDVVLMTIHQSKGLEWDSVAVVGMGDTTFPSNQGDNLRVEIHTPSQFGSADVDWHPAEYKESSKTWLFNQDAVPAPVRVDAGILPRFPHDARVDTPLEALKQLDDVEVIDDEACGDLRDKAAIGEDVDVVDSDNWYLTQSEEYGRRLHADERRLAYVALTRAREEVLLTFREKSLVSRIPAVKEAEVTTDKASNFWIEVFESFVTHSQVAQTPTNIEVSQAQTPDSVLHDETTDKHNNAQDRSSASDLENGTTDEFSGPDEPYSLLQRGVALPLGFFVGENAQQYEDEVVGAAWNEPFVEKGTAENLPWPCDLSDRMRNILDRSAQLVAQEERHETVRDTTVENSNAQSESSSTRADSEQDAGVDTPHLFVSEQNSLALRAQLLIADEELMPYVAETEETASEYTDRHTKEKAQHVLAHSRQNVTSLQAHTGMMSGRQERQYWRGIVRPIPHIASPSAQAGTLFHEWAEQFLGDGEGVSRSSLLDELAEDQANNSRSNRRQAGVNGHDTFRSHKHSHEWEQTADIAFNDVEPPSSISTQQAARSADLLIWKARLAHSRWALRDVVAVERQIVVALPELNNVIVNGKLDAVFSGGLDEHDSTKRFTIVDWKTGGKPTKHEDIEQKLVQLDYYRLLLSVIEGVPIESIDATLYYLSEPSEGKRELHAHNKTEHEILAELSSGIPTESNND